MIKSYSSILFIFLLINCMIPESQSQNTEGNQFLRQLSPYDEMKLKALPELKLPEGYRNRSLPVSVDNSLHPYLRPVFNQSDYCCGQASGIAYNYTYEIDRLRDLPADVPQNQYPTHFSWNFMNEGYGYYGVSYFHSFQMLKECGTPNVVDYGGTLAYGGPERWMSGYDEYYNGMQNRINNVYQINVGNPDGLLILKNWLNDHLENSPVGGIASFYAQYMSANTTLPAGTPEAGKYVLTYFGGSANHAMTIVGYHDSIRYDYNSDGQYTNHIDINNDGTVDMKDWEIGGFKMVQSYGGVPAWGDQGFAFMMYKTVADDIGSGGIWNHTVNTLDIKEDCDPVLTMKVTLKHNNREKIKVTAGLSTSPTATQPDIILEFPIFNYQGGAMYMQGGNSVEEKKTIEFGLDISTLLSHINSGDYAKYFLQVHEADPANSGTGEIVNYSIIDYSDGSNEIPCNQTNVTLVENGTTTLSIGANVTFDKVGITNTSIPPGPVGQNYSCQLMANGGDTLYRWFFHALYDEESSAISFPMVTQLQLNVSNNSNGFASKDLGFDFPFYDTIYSTVVAHVDGYLMFDEQLYPYPYFIDDMVLFTTTRNISPYMTSDLNILSAQNDGIWYEGDANSATFRWKCHLSSNPSQEINCALTLYPSGDIEFFYGPNTTTDDLFWIPGMSDGNDEHYQVTQNYNQGVPGSDRKTTLIYYNYPEELSLTEDGLLSGTIQQAYNGTNMTFRVEDNSFINNYKTFVFSSSGIIIEDSIVSGGDDLVEYGDTALLSVELTNIESNPIQNATMMISTTDTFITILDSIEFLGNLPTGTVQPYFDAFEFVVSQDIPDEHIINIETNITGTRQVWTNSLLYTAYAPELLIQEVIVDDGENGIIDPGDTCNLVINLHNYGGANAYNIMGELVCTDPYVTFMNFTYSVALFEPNSNYLFIYGVIISNQVLINHSIDFTLLLTGDIGYNSTDSFNLVVGRTIEDFETGDFTVFNWGFSGDKKWNIDEAFPEEGIYCARSGNISHGQETSLIIDIEVFLDDSINFYKKVDCEDDQNDNYDYLSFLIDGQEQQRWDGNIDWSLETFSVTPGFHRLEWKYRKDSTVSTGYDKVWIDYISLPSCVDADPHILYSLNEIDKTMLPNTIDTDTLGMLNPLDGSIEYDIWISYNMEKKSGNNSRSIAGAYLEGDIKAIYTSTQNTLTLTLYNASIDNEWLRDVNITFPDFVGVVEATNFVGGSLGDLIYDGSTGYAATVNWHGEDPIGWGVIKQGETATASITFFANLGSFDDIILNYDIVGDIYGNEPHQIIGNMNIVNLGQNEGWLSLDDLTGIIPGNEELLKYIEFDNNGLPDGDYFAKLIIHEQFQHEKIIPIALTVDQFIDVDEEISDFKLLIHPNPFSTNTNIEWYSDNNKPTSIRIFNIHGKLVFSHFTNKQGYNIINWDGKTINSSDAPAGIYFCVMERESISITKKLILLK